jgi:hypothetical protein
MMQQQRSRSEPENSGPPASRGETGLWLRWIAAGAFALTLGLGQAFADTTDTHEGGQGVDKPHAMSSASAGAFAGDGVAHATSTGRSEAVGGTGFARQPPKPELKTTVTVDVSEEGIGTDAWSRTVTRNFVNAKFVTSITKSVSVAIDDDGNTAIAKASAKARAPNNVAAVQAGAGTISSKTSVAVTGNGAASATAGGSIGVVDGGVKVSTWGETSAEVF